MKKYKRLSGLALVAFLVTGCVNTDPNSNSSSSMETTEESSSISSEVSHSESSMESSSSSKNEMTIENYFPFDENVQYSYLGEGNEFASFDRYPQYIDGNRIQYIEKNSGTAHTFVLEYKDGKLTELYSRPETYFRENMMEKTSEGQGEILLKEPLEVGNSWENPSGTVSEITSVDFSVETPLDVFSAIEVTNTHKDSITKSYYVKNIGLVKQEVIANDDSYIVSSTLETISKEAPEVAVIKAYYPDANAMELESSDVNVSFYTNDVTRKTMTELLKQVPGVEYGKLISDNTEMNSLYLNEDGRVYVDFSKELIEDMNAGSSGESLIIQGIVNTIGNYYNVKEVVLTVENQPYESGHYSMNKDESFKVDME